MSSKSNAVQMTNGGADVKYLQIRVREGFIPDVEHIDSSEQKGVGFRHSLLSGADIGLNDFLSSEFELCVVQRE